MFIIRDKEVSICVNLYVLGLLVAWFVFFVLILLRNMIVEWVRFKKIKKNF
jgi:hypothetical protein